MVSSEWGNPNKFSQMFNPAEVAEHYGSKLYFWNWAEATLIKEIDLGPTGLIPLEIRFMHDPDSTHAFVGAALSSAIHHIYRDGNGEWQTERVIQVEPVEVNNWALPASPGLITDILISLDDKYLYFANWLHGDVRQYDITDPHHPKLTGQVFTGGIYQKGSPFTPKDPKVKAHDPVHPRGMNVQGGPQMIQLSLDGKRLYATNSLYSAWDNQFYPDMVKKGSQIVRFNCDTENGGMSLDENFGVDFGGEPNGPSLAHEMRYPGGDCTSDIWI